MHLFTPSEQMTVTNEVMVVTPGYRVMCMRWRFAVRGWGRHTFQFSPFSMTRGFRKDRLRPSGMVGITNRGAEH